MSVPNQKKVRIAPRTPRDKDNLYAMMNIDALSAAVRMLKGSALKMWLYFNKNQDEYEFELSQKACSEWGIKKDSYYDGIDELINKGYLVPTHWTSNVYLFYEIPTEQKPNTFGEIPNRSSDLEKKTSENTERNNINITVIKQNKTIENKSSSYASGIRSGCGKAATVLGDENVSLMGLSEKEKIEIYRKQLGF